CVGVRGSRPSQTARRTVHPPLSVMPARSKAGATRSLGTRYSPSLPCSPKIPRVTILGFGRLFRLGLYLVLFFRPLGAPGLFAHSRPLARSRLQPLRSSLVKVYEGANIRNIAFIGHGHAGKTSLISSLLYTAGLTQRQGRVDDGTATTDYDE